MKKKFLYFLALLIPLFFIETSITKTPEPEGFEEFMKNVDMDQLLKDMEDVFGPIDEKSKTKTKETPKIPVKKTIPSPPVKKEGLETSFKKPFEVSKGESSQKIKKLSKEKREAFLFYMNDFLKKLDLLENKIDSFDLGIPFKEELEDLKLGGKRENYKNLINNIRIQYGRIKSKQLFQRAFYLSSNTQVRENIIKAIKKLKNIEPEIATIKRDDDLLKPQTIKKNNQLKKDITQFFSITLPSISEKLSKVTDTEKIKREIEEKKKKREQVIKTAQRKQTQAAQAAKRKSLFPPATKGRTQPWQQGRRDGFLPPWQDRRRPGSYAPSRETSKLPTTGTKTKRPEKTDSKTATTEDEKKGFSAGKGKKELNKIIGLKKEIAESLKENIINKVSTNLLTEKGDLSEIAQAFKTIKHHQSKLSEEEIKGLQKNEGYKKANTFLTEQLKAAIPYIIKLCKFIPSEIPDNKKQKFETEQKASLEIYSQIQQQKDLKNTAEQELTKYKKEIWEQIEQINKKTVLNNTERKQLQNLLLLFEKEPRGQIYKESEKDLKTISTKIKAPTKEAVTQKEKEEKAATKIQRWFRKHRQKKKDEEDPTPVE